MTPADGPAGEPAPEAAPVAGYRVLAQAEVSVINGLKEKEAEFGRVLDLLDEHVNAMNDQEAGRWVSLARTHAEIAWMFAVKAVARPTNGLGRRQPTA